MAFRIESYEKRFIPAVKAFNQRLEEAGVLSGYRFSETPEEPMPPDDFRLIRNQYLVVDGENVHGGYLMQVQPFYIAGKMRVAANCQLPISEGLINKKYLYVGMLMLRAAIQQYPLLFGVGMGGGGPDQPLPRMYESMGWRVRKIPFFFRVQRASRFLREVRALGDSRLKKIAARIAAASGAGGLALSSLQGARSLRSWLHPRLQIEEIQRWPDWADDIWEQAHREFSFIGLRNRVNLELLYPPGDRLLRYGLRHGSRLVGWITLLHTAMQGHPHFGDLTVGTLVDGLTLPGYEVSAVRAAVSILQERGTDLLVTNQSHRAWIHAVRCAGWLEGPSNYLLASSVELRKLVSPEQEDRVQLVRGDGDGRIHL